MKLSELICEDLILPELKGTDVSAILKEFSNVVHASGKVSDADLIYQRLFEREQQESTGIGNGVAIPHCKIDNLQEVILAIGYSLEGVDFRAMDGNQTFIFFLVLSPSNVPVLHLRTLAALSRLLKSQNFLSHLRQRPDRQELIDLIKREEESATPTS